jgi:hypothetical protein
MSMLNLIWININIMEMKQNMLIYFFILMLVSREKEWDNYKDEVSYEEKNEILIWKEVR